MESIIYSLVGCVVAVLFFLLLRPLFLWYFKIPDIIRNQMRIINDSKPNEPVLELSDRTVRDTNQTSVDDPAELEAFMQRMNKKSGNQSA